MRKWIRDAVAVMTAFIWMLTWLPLVLPAMSALPPPVNLILISNHFRHMLKWGPGPGTPTGAYYSVAIRTDKGTSWVPVAGCERVQHPLVCNLTDAFSNPTVSYFAQVTALLGPQSSLPANHPEFKPIKDTHLDLPLLTVTSCGRNMCVDLQPPMEHLRETYNTLHYKLKIMSSGADRAQFKDIRSLERQIVEDVAPGRQYCVSICFADGLESKESNYSQPICAFTPSIYTADPWISAVLCSLVVFGVICLALLASTGFICLKGGPLPLVLTSLHHIEEVPVIVPYSTAFSSPLNGQPTLPSSGKKRSSLSLSSDSDEECGTESIGGGYKLQVGRNLLSSSTSSSSSLSDVLSPEPEPQPSFSSEHTSDSFISKLEAPVSAETHSTASSNNMTEPNIKEKEVVGEEGSQDVNLLTLIFGRREQEEKEQESHLDVAEVEPQSPSEERNITSVQPSQTWDTREHAIEKVSCSVDEEEHFGYMGRPCTVVL